MFEYGVHTLNRVGLGGLAVRHPMAGEAQVQFLVRPDFESLQHVYVWYVRSESKRCDKGSLTDCRLWFQ